MNQPAKMSAAMTATVARVEDTIQRKLGGRENANVGNTIGQMEYAIWHCLLNTGADRRITEHMVAALRSTLLRHLEEFGRFLDDLSRNSRHNSHCTVDFGITYLQVHRRGTHDIHIKMQWEACFTYTAGDATGEADDKSELHRKGGISVVIASGYLHIADLSCLDMELIYKPARDIAPAEDAKKVNNEAKKQGDKMSIKNVDVENAGTSKVLRKLAKDYRELRGPEHAAGRITLRAHLDRRLHANGRLACLFDHTSKRQDFLTTLRVGIGASVRHAALHLEKREYDLWLAEYIEKARKLGSRMRASQVPHDREREYALKKLAERGTPVDCIDNKHLPHPLDNLINKGLTAETVFIDEVQMMTATLDVTCSKEKRSKPSTRLLTGTMSGRTYLPPVGTLTEEPTKEQVQAMRDMFFGNVPELKRIIEEGARAAQEEIFAKEDEAFAAMIEEKQRAFGEAVEAFGEAVHRIKKEAGNESKLDWATEINPRKPEVSLTYEPTDEELDGFLVDLKRD